VACGLGAVMMFLIISVKTNDKTGVLTFYLTGFQFFESGASILISCILCDIGKEQLLNHNRKTIATISGICDGFAGLGSILGQVLLGPMMNWTGWTGTFYMFALSAVIATFPAIPYVVKDIKLKCTRTRNEQNI
jgi:sugar phosphate permease